MDGRSPAQLGTCDGHQLAGNGTGPLRQEHADPYITYSEFLSDVDADQVKTVTIASNGQASGTFPCTLARANSARQRNGSGTVGIPSRTRLSMSPINDAPSLQRPKSPVPPLLVTRSDSLVSVTGLAIDVQQRMIFRRVKREGRAASRHHAQRPRL